MKTVPSAALGRYLSRRPDTARPASPSTYVVEGADTVTPADLTGLRQLLPQIRKKLASVKDSARFRDRVEMLTRYIDETTNLGGTPERREIAFVLFYFLKGYDLIPDALPEIGLLDDALMVETAFNRNQLALRSHWAAQGRTWPENS